MQIARFHRRLLLPCALVTLTLAGCGGGGSSGAAPPAAPVAVPNRAPTASLTASDTAGEVPLDVTFSAAGSSDPDGIIAAFDWDFGDGSTGSGISIDHRYDSAGTFTATLTVADDDGAAASASTLIEVVEPVETYTLSGTILIQASSVIDSDTNDSNTTPIANDDLGTAQLVPNPATVGGYVSAPGSGAAGAVSAAGDTRDVYRFTAAGGEVIALTIGTENEDLDLLLLDEAGNQIAESLGTTSTEVVGPIADPGDYFIQVSTFLDAASNYVLTIGQTGGIATAAAGNRSDALRGSLVDGSARASLGTTTAGVTDPLTDAAFVPGEVLLGERVRPGTGSRDAPAVPLTTAWEAGRTRLARLQRPFEVRGERPRDAAALSGAARRRLATLEAIKHLRAAGDHAWVEPNWIRRKLRTPNDRFFPNQWHYEAIRLPQAWALTEGDPNVIVAVIDTGILALHPEFTNPADPVDSQLVAGYDFISDPANAGDGDGIDPDPNDEGDNDLASASSFHGTHVAGTVAARTDNGAGGAGVGWNTRVMPLRVLGLNGGTSADLIQALRFAGRLPNSSGTLPERAADIINLSLGSNGSSQAEQQVIDELRAAGIIVIAAAGNDASSVPFFPAAYGGVVSVSATTITSDLAFYSNFGATVDVAAPGGDNSTDVNGDGIADGVISPVGDDSDGDPATPPEPRLGVLAGTSMAAPHVAGVAALMKAVHPALTPEEFDALLASGTVTEDLGAPGRDDRFGYGLINAQKAVLAALAAAGSPFSAPAILIASPGGLNFGSFETLLEFRLSNAGSTALVAQPPTADVPWLTVTGIDVDPETGLGTFTATVDRSLLPEPGIFNGLISVTSDANTLTIPVQIQLTEADVFADTGFTYILITTEDGNESFVETTASANGGSYSFSLTDVPAGRYRLFAGSDSNNDGFICDGGESCGVFRTFDSPTVIEVESDRGGLDFVTAFRASISASSDTLAADAARTDPQLQSGSKASATPPAATASTLRENRIRIRRRDPARD